MQLQLAGPFRCSFPELWPLLLLPDTRPRVPTRPGGSRTLLRRLRLWSPFRIWSEPRNEWLWGQSAR